MPVSFFCRTSATNIWKSVTGVSAAGAKRGRGKGAGRAIVKDFNRGQEIGVGRRRINLGGLNTPVAVAQKFTDVQDVGENIDFHQNLHKVREEMNVYKKFRENPMDRGWSGRRAHGRKAGPPDDYNETQFEGFESTILMLRPLQRMTGVYGRVRYMQALVVTGNKNGIAGFATATSKDGKKAIRQARNKAGQSLIRVPIWEKHTVMHDFFSKYYHTTVFVERKPKGYGIRAHRAIKACCDAFGITDMFAVTKGNSKNKINLVKAFFLGLMNQKQYQEIADDKQLHLVEIRAETLYYPNILASPKTKLKTDQELKNSQENLDFTYYIYDGKIKQVAAKRKNPLEETPTYYKFLDKLDYGKNRLETRLLLAAKYGDKKVLDVFPLFKTTNKLFNKSREGTAEE